MPNWKCLAQTVSEIWRESQNLESRSRDPFPTHFDLIFHFLSLLHKVVNLHAKFENSNSNRSRDMEGVPQFKK